MDRAGRRPHTDGARPPVVHGRDAYLLEYELQTSAGYVTERLDARIDGGPGLTLVRGSSSDSTECSTASSDSRR